METHKDLRHLTPVELMLKWNRFCDASGREGDCILLNEERTFTEAFDSEEQAMQEILNSEELIENEGFLIPVYYDGKYGGMKWVAESDIGKHIDLGLME